MRVFALSCVLLCSTLARCARALQLGVDECAPTVCTLHQRPSVSFADYNRVFVAFNHPDKGGLLAYSQYFNECRAQLFKGKLDLDCALVERVRTPAVIAYEQHRESRQFKLYGKAGPKSSASSSKKKKTRGDGSSGSGSKSREQPGAQAGGAQRGSSRNETSNDDTQFYDEWIDLAVGAREFLREQKFSPAFRWAHFYADHSDVSSRSGAFCAARHIFSALQPAVDALEADWRKWQELNGVIRSYKKLRKDPPASVMDRVAAFTKRYTSLEKLERDLGECEYYIRAFVTAGLGAKTFGDFLLDLLLSAGALLASLLVGAFCAFLTMGFSIASSLFTYTVVKMVSSDFRRHVARSKDYRSVDRHISAGDNIVAFGVWTLGCLCIYYCDTVLRWTSPLGASIADFFSASHHPLVWACLGLPYMYSLTRVFCVGDLL